MSFFSGLKDAFEVIGFAVREPFAGNANAANSLNEAGGGQGMRLKDMAEHIRAPHDFRLDMYRELSGAPNEQVLAFNKDLGLVLEDMLKQSADMRAGFILFQARNMIIAIEKFPHLYSAETQNVVDEIVSVSSDDQLLLRLNDIKSETIEKGLEIVRPDDDAFTADKFS